MEQADFPKGIEEDEEEFIVLPQLTEEELAKFEQQNEQRIRNFYKETQNYQMQNWYPTLSTFTFPSFALTLTSLQAYVIHRLYYNYQLTVSEENARKMLEQRVNLLLKNKFGGQGCFMKLSTRSPKDYCWDYRSQKASSVLTEQLVTFLKEIVDPQVKQLSSDHFNRIYKFLLMNSRRKLMIESGQDFVNIFSKSQRIAIDLYDFSQMKGKIFQEFRKGNYQRSQQPLMNVWAREWRNYEWFEEVRCFYHNYNLTAISQYDQRCFFSQLVNQEAHIKQIVSNFFQKLKPSLQSLQLDQGVMDIVLKKLSTPQLVQINVFNENTRGSLFNWKSDSQQLKQGSTVQVRILKESKVERVHIESMMGMIEKDISKAIHNAFNLLKLPHLWPIIN